MNVKLISYTPDGEKIISAAAKLCYSSSDVDGILDGLDKENINKFLTMLMDLGHESPIEHVSFTFAIEGVSRALTHQLVRHRIASYSQKSQRYVSEGQFEYIVPEEIKNDNISKELFISAMESAQKSYDDIAKRLTAIHYARLIKDGADEKKAKLTAEKSAIEDARFVLPNACETKIIATFNARSLMNFFKHRCCSRAQWEIRQLAQEMVELVQPIMPTLFRFAGPACVSGICPEGSKSCGKQKKMREKYLKDN